MCQPFHFLLLCLSVISIQSHTHKRKQQQAGTVSKKYQLCGPRSLCSQCTLCPASNLGTHLSSVTSNFVKLYHISLSSVPPPLKHVQIPPKKEFVRFHVYIFVLSLLSSEVHMKTSKVIKQLLDFFLYLYVGMLSTDKPTNQKLGGQAAGKINRRV